MLTSAVIYPCYFTLCSTFSKGSNPFSSFV